MTAGGGKQKGRVKDEPLPNAPQNALRVRIYGAMENAHARACAARHLDASEIYHVASGIASRWAFRRTAGCEELQEVVRILNQLYAAAGSLEWLEDVL